MHPNAKKVRGESFRSSDRRLVVAHTVCTRHRAGKTSLGHHIPSPAACNAVRISSTVRPGGAAWTKPLIAAPSHMRTYSSGSISGSARCAARLASDVFPRTPAARVLSAKLFVYAVAGAAYGLILATTEGLALYGGAAVRGLTVGAEPAVVLRILLSLMITMTVYTVLGVGVGTVLRNQTATLTVLGGYLYMVEHSLAIIPGFQQIYPFLSGSATASLTDFTLLSQAAVELGITATPLLPPVIGAGVLAGYGITAAALAVLMPLRREVT